MAFLGLWVNLPYLTQVFFGLGLVLLGVLGVVNDGDPDLTDNLTPPLALPVGLVFGGLAGLLTHAILADLGLLGWWALSLSLPASLASSYTAVRTYSRALLWIAPEQTLVAGPTLLPGAVLVTSGRVRRSGGQAKGGVQHYPVHLGTGGELARGVEVVVCSYNSEKHSYLVEPLVD